MKLHLNQLDPNFDFDLHSHRYYSPKLVCFSIIARGEKTPFSHKVNKTNIWIRPLCLNPPQIVKALFWLGSHPSYKVAWKSVK